MSNDPYGHLFFECPETKSFINTTKLRGFIFKSTGGKTNWLHERTTKFHKPHFVWCYKAIDYDLSRHFSYKNLIAMIFHQVWIWICNQLYSDIKIQDAKLDYDIILKKWYKSATLDCINKVKNYNISSSKDTLSIKNKTHYIKNIKSIKNQIIKDCCLPNTVLPNRIIVDQFI
ncbi:hypothetical protein ACTFIW_004059 [Dictyostelium discoideum]